MNNIVLSLVSIGIFCFLGIMLHRGKGAWIISGYNTMSEKEKKQYDEKVLCKGMSYVMFALAGSMIFTILGELLKIDWFVYITLGLMMLIILIAIIIGNFSDYAKVKK